MAVSIGKFSGHTGNNNFVGIEKTGLNAIRGVIQDYEKEVEKTLDKMCTDIDPKTAFAGENLTKAVQDFVKAVNVEAKEWTSQINKYCVTIDDMVTQMENTETQLASGIDTSSKSVSAQTDAYTYGGGSSSAS